MSETKHTPLPVNANPGDGRIFDADGKILCWMGGAGVFEESEILTRRDELIASVNARPKVQELVRVAKDSLQFVKGMQNDAREDHYFKLAESAGASASRLEEAIRALESVLGGKAE